MSKIIHKICPVCESSKLRSKFHGKDYSHSPENFEVLVCADCGFVFTQGVPDEKTIGKYYQSEDYVSHSDKQEGIFFKVYHLVRNYMLGRKRKLVEKNTHKGRLLDLGCGTGYFLNEMKSHGWETVGIEQDAQARKFGNEKFGLNIKMPNHLFHLEKSSFDAITMWHVLEHVHDLTGYLQQLNAILKFNGVLYIAVPNHDSFDANYYKEHWAAWDLPIHLWHFTPHTIKKTLKQNGFNLSSIHSMPFDSFYVSILSEKYQKGNAIKGLWIGFLSFFKSLFNTKKASSVIYVFKKDQ
jgi:2-polyprenyl-3-methyl-5-hydroxy-6-metoxy-1,4-benzoquinol methylase